MKNLTPNDIAKLRQLFHQIRGNHASTKDYQEYENILIKAGFSQIEIRKNLYSYNLSDWIHFHRAKQQAKSYDEKRVFEVIIKGTLLGLGLAALIAIAKGK